MRLNYKKYLAEGFLIVFSVLFALFINKMYDDHQTQKKKNIALAGIVQELHRNKAILAAWKSRHEKIRDRISGVIEGRGDSLRAELKQYDYLNLGILTNGESLVDDILTSTAWESAKTTGVISEFDFETTQKLTHVYTMQEVLMESTMAKILDYYFNSEEALLAELFEDAIAHLQQ